MKGTQQKPIQKSGQAARGEEEGLGEVVVIHAPFDPLIAKSLIEIMDEDSRILIPYFNMPALFVGNIFNRLNNVIWR